MKPTLKKVSKYENKFAKLQKKAAEFNFRNQLKVVKKKEFTLEEEEKEVSRKALETEVTLHSCITKEHFLMHLFILSLLQKKPDWSKGKPGDAKVNEVKEEVEAWTQL